MSKKQQYADAYGAGQVKQAKITGRYPPSPVHYLHDLWVLGDLKSEHFSSAFRMLRGQHEIKPTMQEFKHNPPETWGDCHRACYATILCLPREAVPHFYHGCSSHQEAMHRFDQFHANSGIWPFVSLYECDLDMLLAHQAMANPDMPYILGGQSPRGVNHSVVAMNDQIIHDPAPQGGGVVAPADNGNYSVTFLMRRP